MTSGWGGCQRRQLAVAKEEVLSDGGHLGLHRFGGEDFDMVQQANKLGGGDTPWERLAVLLAVSVMHTGVTLGRALGKPREVLARVVAYMYV